MKLRQSSATVHQYFKIHKNAFTQIRIHFMSFHPVWTKLIGSTCMRHVFPRLEDRAKFHEICMTSSSIISYTQLQKISLFGVYMQYTAKLKNSARQALSIHWNSVTCDGWGWWTGLKLIAYTLWFAVCLKDQSNQDWGSMNVSWWYCSYTITDDVFV